MSHRRFAAMIVASTVIMFGLMYLNIYALEHLRFSQTRPWMALIIRATMAVVMMGFMWGMYRDRRPNLIILGAALCPHDSAPRTNASNAARASPR